MQDCVTKESHIYDVYVYDVDLMISKMYIRQLATSGLKINLYTKLWRTLHNKPKEANSASEIEIPMPWGKVSGEYRIL